MPRWDDIAGGFVPEYLPQDYRTPLDIALELGYAFYKQSLCSRCGVPAWYGRSTDGRIDFETEDMVCYACQHLEQKENSEGGKNGGRKPGVTKVVRPVGLKYEAIGRQDPLPPPWEAMRGL